MNFNRWKFPILCAAVLAVMVALYLANAIVRHDYYDEGVYLRDAELVAAGLQPYRDFVLLHPPVGVKLWAVLLRLGAAAETVKKINLLFSGALVVLVMTLVRRLGGPLSASAFSGILLAANVHFWLFSRFIHLELLLSFFLLCSATLFLLGKGKVSAVGAGVFAALAIGTKFTAIFLIVPLAALLIVRRGDRRRLYLAAGAGLVVLLVVLSDLRFPEVRRLLIDSQFSRPSGLPGSRIGLLYGIFLQDPLFWLVAAAAPLILLAARGQDQDLRRPAAVIIGAGILATVLSAVVPRNFHDYYIFFTLPFLAAGIGLCAASFPAARRVTLAVSAMALIWIGLWRFVLPDDWSDPPVISALRAGTGTVFVENPMLARLAGREPCPGYYFSDPYSLGLLGVSSERLWEDLGRCDEVLLDRKSVASEVVVVPYEIRSRLRQEGELIYRDDRYRLYRLK
ncbi:hypothetical protein A3D72_04415 [Candidatus Uhrbacteria bacterium RIFCSPHIGHO2_02_FULL_57_19]|uniref:Glycosyltransferase RgtA/B/C/D-like domain-containing protein n=1 Tax=Candidatus Uhrbacteria bacterium RIFCSPHIGHO2_02_FULL_57_19 TaxID=1802391 RepID=A0A1F7U675_9BACT|nr:MAG: hypothetical protein A3D72_04415 [Candidatus Uhrbacteria bacterium RIFCSPHIGHO2_02_FULL_57_19]